MDAQLHEIVYFFFIMLLFVVSVASSSPYECYISIKKMNIQCEQSVSLATRSSFIIASLCAGKGTCIYSIYASLIPVSLCVLVMSAQKSICE